MRIRDQLQLTKDTVVIGKLKVYCYFINIELKRHFNYYFIYQILGASKIKQR